MIYHFSALLLSTLQQKSTRLIRHSTLDFLITSTNDGFMPYMENLFWIHTILLFMNLFNQLALILPLISLNGFNTLCSGALWLFFEGLVFIIKFVAGLHASLCFNLGTDLEHHIDHPCYDNCPLPFDFMPAHLWVQLQQCAQFIGFHGQVLALPWDTHCNSNVHQILSSVLPNDDDSSIYVDTSLAAIYSSGLTVFAMMHPTLHF